MRVIVLGGNGQIGSFIHDHLSKRYEVTGTSRRASGRCVKFDPFHDDWFGLGKADVLVNCVGQIAAAGPDSFYKVHVDLTRHIISNRAIIGNPRIVQISALGASSRHATDFLRTKGIADELLLQQPDTVVVRPSVVCTSRTTLVNKMLMLSRVAQFTAGVLFVPKGFLQTRMQPVMPRDLAAVVEAMCVSGEHRVVDVVGPDVLSFRDILSLLLESKKRKVKLVEVPRTLMDLPMKYLISTLIPSVINAQQYALLFEDNTADNGVCTKMLRRVMTSVIPFFKNEFADARH